MSKTILVLCLFILVSQSLAFRAPFAYGGETDPAETIKLYKLNSNGYPGEYEILDEFEIPQQELLFEQKRNVLRPQNRWKTQKVSKKPAME